MSKKNPRFIIALVFALVVGVVGWRYLLNKVSRPKISASNVPSPVRLDDIPLESSDAKITKLSDLRSKWSLFFFGFTRCPDVCPTTLAYLAKEYANLLELRPHVRVVFVSVDNERDNVDQCAIYVRNFEPSFKCAMAKPSDLKELTKQLGVHYAQDGKGEGYKIQHSGDIFLISPEGEWVSYYRPPFQTGQVQADLQKLVTRTL